MPLRLTLEVIPHGDTSRTEEIGRLYITQVEQLEGEFRKYEIADTHGRKWWVEHNRSRGAWALVQIAAAFVHGPPNPISDEAAS